MTVISLSKSAGRVSHAGQIVVDTDVWVTSNETGRKEVQTLLAAEKLRGNAVYGCSGTEVLNLASICDGIEHISVFDNCPSVQKLWEMMPKIILTLNPGKLEESQKSFCSWTKAEYDTQHFSVEQDIRNGTSFLSTSERLTRIIKIFQAHKPTAPKVTFTLCDAGNPREFLVFNLAQQKLGAKAHVYYISNIVACDMAFKKGMEMVEGYERSVRSMSYIPKQAIVIDAVYLPDASGVQQRMHIDKREDLVGSYQVFFKQARICDDYHAVRHCISKGADTSERDVEGWTYLATAAENGRLQTMMALLDSGIHPDTPNQDETTALHGAAIVGQLDAIELLVSRKANIDALDIQKMTPLHQATLHGKLESIRTLLSLGADRSKRAQNGCTSLHLMQTIDTPIYQMRTTPAYKEIQTLLKKGCATRKPKEFTAPSITAPPEGKKTDEKGDKKSEN